jgi:hypothetical protein
MNIEKVVKIGLVLFGIFFVIIFYENYICSHKRIEKEVIVDTLYKDTLRVDTCMVDSIKTQIDSIKKYIKNPRT